MKRATIRRASERGFSLVAIAVSSLAILGVLGLTIDLGRSYIIKTELQAYSDAAALAAAFLLDGTAAGLTKADAVAATGPITAGAPANRYDFDTKAVPTVQAKYSTTFSGAYQTSGSAPANSRFVQVKATANAPFYFLPVLPGVGSSLGLTVISIAGQSLQTSVGQGSNPFSPDAHTPADANFGFTVGQFYTLKWPPKGQRGKAGNTCSGDSAFTPPNSSADRGFIDVGQGSGNAGLHDAIVNTQFDLASPYTVGSVINWVPGNKDVSPAITERFNQDTDTISATYATYTGNGRRLMVVPVNNDADPALVAGFAEFFMPPNICGSKNTNPCCAEYLGPGLLGGSNPGAGGGSGGAGSGAGAYAVKLLR